MCRVMTLFIFEKYVLSGGYMKFRPSPIFLPHGELIPGTSRQSLLAKLKIPYWSSIPLSIIIYRWIRDKIVQGFFFQIFRVYTLGGQHIDFPSVLPVTWTYVWLQYMYARVCLCTWPSWCVLVCGVWCGVKAAGLAYIYWSQTYFQVTGKTEGKSMFCPKSIHSENLKKNMPWRILSHIQP